MSIELFDLQVVHDHFKKSQKDDEDVYMDTYLEGFKELNKFFHLMGSVFGFVSSDVKSKVEILEELRKKENGDRFVTFKSMLDYEKSEGLLNKSDYVSGSRTLLRLHRGLDFIHEFLRKLSEMEPTEKTCHVCQTAYNDTLAQFHPWIVRKGAVVAMYALPTQQNLLKRVCKDLEHALVILPDTLGVIKNVYDRTQNLYTVCDLHGLP